MRLQLASNHNVVVHTWL